MNFLVKVRSLLKRAASIWWHEKFAVWKSCKRKLELAFEARILILNAHAASYPNGLPNTFFFISSILSFQW